jgi:plasmid maintenance system antidote protein VapI
VNQPIQIPPPENLPIALRAFIGYPKEEKQKGGRTTPPSEWTLVFDTETESDAAQRLRFGAYEIHQDDALYKRGLFYDPEGVKEPEFALLQKYSAREKIASLFNLAEFVEHVLFRYAYDLRGSIVGFNLPFDISRLATVHGSARGSTMRGGFTFTLTPKFLPRDDSRRYRPRIQVKHRSQRSAFVQFAAPFDQLDARSERKRQHKTPVRRGYYFDLKTIAAALTSESHSLESLSQFLDVQHKKLKTDEHGRRLTEEYIAYALRDVETSWECFVALRDQYNALGLTRTQLNQIQSEAGIGKGYLRQMNVRPWREMQPDFPRPLVGNIMSAYFGGRAEVHIRRKITRVLYHDFLSMYPTVCTLMGLWRFAIARSMGWRDTTEETRAILEGVTLEELQRPEFWPQLVTLVQIEPDADILPVRALYSEGAQHTIGLNYLTSKVPLWFVLADCIGSKLLSGKAPKVLRAITYEPSGTQSGLLPIQVMGNPAYRIEPRQDDFYRSVIDLRTQTKNNAKTATGKRKARLEVEQQLLKIMGNATSYGIFMELNPDQATEEEELTRYGVTAGGVPMLSRKIERPGVYFHPMLAAVITGAARLMLAINERLALEAGFDWAICDTDSMALAKPEAMSDREFLNRAEGIRNWFLPLNPYAKKEPLLKLEDENKRFTGGRVTDALEPLFLYAVSAKRYALFNLDRRGKPILRKISIHGLGQYMEPYADEGAPREFPKPLVPLKDLKAKRWQHDLWYRQIVAALTGTDGDGNPADHPVFEKPAASRYHATKPRILRWFRKFNEGRGYAEQIKPFNFLLAFQPNYEAMLAAVIRIDDKSDRPHELDARAIPKPVAPYSKNVTNAAREAFDRITGQPVPQDHLMTYPEALAAYFIHPESKFLSGGYRDRGLTHRRHIQIDITNIRYIGKESNDADEQFYLGFDDEAQLELGEEPESQTLFLEMVRDADKNFRRRPFAKAAGISARHLTAITSGRVRLTRAMTAKLMRGIEKLGAERTTRGALEEEFLVWARDEAERIALRELARRLGVDPANLAKVLVGQRNVTEKLIRAWKQYS